MMVQRQFSGPATWVLSKQSVQQPSLDAYVNYCLQDVFLYMCPLINLTDTF